MCPNSASPASSNGWARNIEAGIVATRGIAEFGLARMIDIRHEFSAVRELTTGMCISMLRTIGGDPRRIDALVDDAIRLCVPPTLTVGAAYPVRVPNASPSDRANVSAIQSAMKSRGVTRLSAHAWSAPPVVASKTLSSRLGELTNWS